MLLGADVVLIENKDLGGVCLNVGCIPTKALLHCSEFANIGEKSEEFGVKVNSTSIDWQEANQFKNRVVKNQNIGLEGLLLSKGIVILKGKGTPINPQKILVSTQDGDIDVTCEKLILASGASPILLNIIGVENDGVITSNEALSLEAIPKSITIIGAGAIGLEFATMFNSVGVKVLVIEQQDRILPCEDKEITAELMKIMKRQGIAFKLSSTITEIEKTDNGLNVKYNSKGIEATKVSEKVLVAVGRKLNIDCFSNLTLEMKNTAISVNEAMETSLPDVYAVGDITGGKLLAHLAFAEGKMAAENALGINSRINKNAVPSCVYTNPEVASVGISEDEAIEKNIVYKVGRFSFQNNGRAGTLGEREGFVKIIIGEDNIILGGQILATSASELISELTLAITLSAKADVLADMIHPHPTLSEAIWEACADAIGRAIHK